MMRKNTLVLVCVYVFFELAVFCFSRGGLSAQGVAQYPANVEVIETDILQGVVGFKGELQDAEVIAVNESEDGKTRILNIVVPVDPDEVDRVQLVFPSAEHLESGRIVEISMDHENHEVGVTITLPNRSNLDFKLNLIDLSGEQ